MYSAGNNARAQPSSYQTPAYDQGSSRSPSPGQNRSTDVDDRTNKNSNPHPPPPQYSNGQTPGTVAYNITVQQPPVAYGLSPGGIFVNTGGPGPGLTSPPDDRFIFSVVSIFFCWVIGIFAILKSLECRSAIRSGDRPVAELKSLEARKFGRIAIIVGSILIVLSIIGGCVFRYGYWYYY